MDGHTFEYYAVELEDGNTRIYATRSEHDLQGNLAENSFTAVVASIKEIDIFEVLDRIGVEFSEELLESGLGSEERAKYLGKYLTEATSEPARV